MPFDPTFPRSGALYLRNGRVYVLWDAVLDQLASERGYGSGDELREEIGRLKKNERHLRKLGAQIREAKA